MRVAFCISGQLRDEDLSFPATARLAQQFAADVFISTWSVRGAKTSGVINSHQAARMFGDRFERALPRRMLGGGQLIRLFPELEALLDDRSSVDPQTLLGWFPNATLDLEDADLLDLGFRQPDVEDVNSLRMLYKLWRCNQMKLRRERDLSALYDVVVRFRPDVVPALSPELLASVAADGRLVLIPEGRARPDYLNDIAAASGSAMGDQLAALFAAAVQSPQRPWRLIHFELSQHLEQAGADVRELPLQQHITSAMDVRRPRNREILIAEFDRTAEARLELPPADRALFSDVLGLLHRLESGEPAEALVSALQRLRFDAGRDALYSAAVGGATLHAAAGDERSTAAWAAIGVLLATAPPELWVEDIEERSHVWLRLLREPAGFSGRELPAAADLAPALAGDEAGGRLLAAAEGVAPDLAKYGQLRESLALRLGH